MSAVPSPAAMPKLFYISFADGALPEGTQFLGACIVEAVDLLDAIQTSHRLGCNPGGEAQVIEVPAGTLEIPAKFRDRLLDREAIDEMDRAMGAIP